ncbi:cellulose synthase/poly-beta-1,6-N-acetylglucosamine synthase-like glycosyltransferase [Lutibacter oceani]|uniref:Cellulose synthase/poly-beta-1,6-N-acetylglucosamine synthase-like glycosyltransferase n=1 Tax=Lutibacter oceani TaxID=1853311 RepID=A0A3D9RM26_9FLAO|nr:glycosyltransferase [Lutibacter oceani]REE80608.1 cellulose synthase/poly-beta-1,6-N-acetylglucosamine synthase-like glycosyltransferase [Lutibacter oceani]
MLFSILISIIYFLLIGSFIIGFDKVKTINLENVSAKNSFSIVIPFRNEAKNLPELLHSLSLLNYPKNLFEILLINDASTDDFNSIIQNFIRNNPNLNVYLLNNQRETKSPKKDAINTAISNSRFNWIVTTDADCQVPKNWLQLFNQTIKQEQPFFISAPVKFKAGKSFLFHFQNLNFLSLIGSTIGGFGINRPFMCNGANLCYHKNTFIEINGFFGNSNISSGDDVFLLEKINKKYPEKVKFLKSIEATVETKPENNFNSFLNQQLRWASKSTAYNNTFSKFIGTLVFTMNLTVIILGFLTIIFTNYLNYFLSITVLKISIDAVLIFKTSNFLNNIKSLKYYLPISLLYPIFIMVAGSLSFFKSYNWKGRTFKK